MWAPVWLIYGWNTSCSRIIVFFIIIMYTMYKYTKNAPKYNAIGNTRLVLVLFYRMSA